MSKETPKHTTPNSNPSSGRSAKSDSQSSDQVVDRRQRSGGIAEGGRRKADRAVVAPISQSSRIWFGLSLILTLVIMIWTFSVPFRTEKPIFAWEKADLPSRVVPISREILDDPEHAMTDDQYKAYIWELEDELQEQMKERNRIPDNLPDTKAAKVGAKRKVANMEKELAELAKMEAKVKDGFDEKSIQFQAMENVRKKLTDSGDLFPDK